jgi:hypothetical protein
MNEPDPRHSLSEPMLSSVMARDSEGQPTDPCSTKTKSRADQCARNILAMVASVCSSRPAAQRSSHIEEVSATVQQGVLGELAGLRRQIFEANLASRSGPVREDVS